MHPFFNDPAARSHSSQQGELSARWGLLMQEAWERCGEGLSLG